MLRDVASILEAGSAVIVMITLIVIIALVFTGCILSGVVAVEFVRVLQTPVPY